MYIPGYNTVSTPYPREWYGGYPPPSLLSHGPQGAVCLHLPPSPMVLRVLYAQHTLFHGPQGAICPACLSLPWSSGCCMPSMSLFSPMVLRVLYAQHVSPPTVVGRLPVLHVGTPTMGEGGMYAPHGH